MIPYKTPHFINQKIEDNFYAVVNSWQPNSLRVITQHQLDLLNLVDGVNSVEEIAKRLKIDSELVDSVLRLFIDSGIVKFSNIFDEYEKKSRKPNALNLWIHTTNKCNLTCNYCYISTLQTTGAMKPEVIKKLGDNLFKTAKNRKLKQIKIRLAGGEPLLQFKQWKPFILEMQERFKEIGSEFSASFLTNLTFLSDEIIDFAKENKIGFGVSLDGFDFYHDITRKFHNGKGSFDIVDKNLQILKDNGIRPSISTVVTGENMEGLPALTEYLIEKGLHFRYSIVRGENINRDRLSKILSESYQIMEKAIERGWNFANLHKLCDLKPSELGFQTCASGFSGGAVYVDGGVYFCHVQFGKDGEANGSIFEENADMLTLIERGSNYLGVRSDDCQTCNYKHICTSGCPMYREEGKDPNCGIYHEFVPQIYRLMGKERLIKIKKMREPIQI